MRVGLADQGQPERADHRQQEAQPGVAADPLPEQEERAHRHQQWQQRGDHPGLGGAGVLQRQGFADEVQAGLADRQAEQVLPVTGAILGAPAPAPGGEEDQAANGHAGEDHPHRREFLECQFQGNERTAPQRHGQHQAREGERPGMLHGTLQKTGIREV
ncbi:hypothetical protein D9M68_749220 [compost metagenome]